MSRTILVAALMLVALPMAAMGQAPPAQGVEYRLEIACPGTAFARTCPITAIDGQDAMGDPSLAVDPDNPDSMIIASLHGSGDSNGPSPKSRSGQAFTTFTSTNHGGYWRDNPFFPPQDVAGGYGQHPALTIDPYGHVFVGSLYAERATTERGPDAPYEYVIAAQKFDDIRDINTNQNGRYNLAYIGSHFPRNEIQQMWFTYNRITDHMTMVWTEKVTAHSMQTASEEGAAVGPTMADVLALRGEGATSGDDARSTDATRSVTPAMSVIGVVWTGADLESGYKAQPLSDAIGPCSASTNPVISEGWLYIGCKVAEGEGPLRWNPDAEPGRVEMFRMDPDGGTPQYIGTTPIVGGDPKLGVRSDGRIALMTAAVEGGEIRLDAVFGQYNDEKERIVWGGLKRFGDNLDVLPPDQNRTSAAIQDMMYREYSGVLHLILKETVEYNDTASKIVPIPRPMIKKSIVAIDEKLGVLAEMDLDIGDIATRSQDPVLYSQSEEVFNDTSDDFLELPAAPFEFQGRDLGEQYQREFFAVADYGIVLFAEVIEITDLRGPGVAPSPPPPPPPVPAPAPAQVLAAAGALTASTLITATVATAKRKHVVKAGPKKRN